MRISLPSVSLAAKCRILFGSAVLLIIAAALTVPWLRMTDLVLEKNIRIAADAAMQAARRADLTPGDWVTRQRAVENWWWQEVAAERVAGPAPKLIPIDDPLYPEAPPGSDEHLKHCVRLLARRPGLTEAPLRVEKTRTGVYVCRSIAPLRSRGDPYPAGTLLGVVSVDYPAASAATDLMENISLVCMAGALAGILAVLVFYMITQRLILSPVRELRAVADQVSAGDHHVRSRIATGDEFEDLARAFNAMLAHLQQQQEELQTINRSLDTRVGELAERNVALFEANRVKSQFLANVSHELRTPLTSIIGFAELLREGTADPQRLQRYLDNVLTSGRMLLGLINDLLDLAKIEAGKLILHLGPVNLNEMAANLLDFMQPQAEKKQLVLAVDVAPDVPVLHSDSGRIQQILYNLLSNAIKFSAPGGRVSMTCTCDGPQHVALIVSDTGIGIPEDQLPHLFEKFWQRDGSMTREHSGTGLGLAITRDLVHVLGGSISVRSVEGQGSTFRVVLPVRAPDTAEMPLPSLT